MDYLYDDISPEDSFINDSVDEIEDVEDSILSDNGSYIDSIGGIDDEYVDSYDYDINDDIEDYTYDDSCTDDDDCDTIDYEIHGTEEVIDDEEDDISDLLSSPFHDEQ